MSQAGGGRAAKACTVRAGFSGGARSALDVSRAIDGWQVGPWDLRLPCMQLLQACVEAVYLHDNVSSISQAVLREASTAIGRCWARAAGVAAVLEDDAQHAAARHGLQPLHGLPAGPRGAGCV